MESEMAEEPSATARGGGGPLAAVAEEGESEVEAAPATAGSSKTMERVAAAKKFIEGHYRAQMKNIQERKERYRNPKPRFNFCSEP
jgi:serine/threonine kinase 38